MTDVPEEDKKVGYCKPPKKYRFKKGQSGNPGGRPRSSKSIDDVIINSLNRRVPMRINGKLTKVTVSDALIMAQIKKAIDNGDTKAAKFLTDSYIKAEQNKYYMDTAAKHLNKQITRALYKQASNPKEAQELFNEARMTAEEALARYEDEDGER